MKNDFDRLFTSVPVNRSAALAVSGGGERYEPAVKTDSRYWDTPPPLPPLPENCQDLTGTTFGRLVVVGYYGSGSGGGGKGSIWLVRCKCGAYETRRTKSIKKLGNGFHACHKCDYQKHLKRQQFFDRAKRWPTDDEARRIGIL